MSHAIIDEIRDWHRKRNAAMEIRKRADLALGANLRTWLGWRKDLPEEDRRRIANAAADLIDCGETLAKGKPHNLSDTEEFKAFSDFIGMAIESRKATDKYEGIATKEMERLAVQLPVWPQFGEPIKGFGARSMAVIIGEAGDLANYATHSKLWKRMGLAVMDGVRQGGLRKAATKETWIAHGYSPIRRSRMWNIGDALVKGNKDGRYRTAYLSRKEYERNRAAFEGKTVAPAAKIPKGRAEEFMSDGHIHLRAQRYMEKRLLRDLWKAWRAVSIVPERANRDLPAEIADAARAAGGATVEMPAMAIGRMPPRKSKAPKGAVVASQHMPKGHGVSAATKNKKAAKPAGRATALVPNKAKQKLPDHQSGDAR